MTTSTGNSVSGSALPVNQDALSTPLSAALNPTGVAEVADSKFEEAEQHQSSYKKMTVKKQRKLCSLQGCRRKITFSDEMLKCLCDRVFCNEHRFHSNHDCTFDFKKRNMERLKRELDPDQEPRHRKSYYEKPGSNYTY